MLARQRRILHLINGVDDTFGGSLSAAVNIAEAMAADGAAVTLSAPVRKGGSYRTIDLMDARVDRRMFWATRPLARFGGSLRQMWWLWREVRTFDEVQTHLLFSLSTVYAVVICSMRRVPIFLWPHGSIYPDDLLKHARIKSTLGPLITRRLFDRCAALLFTAGRESRMAVTYGSQVPHEVVPLPVEPLPLDGADPIAWRKRHGVPEDVPVVLFLGRINYKKRLPLLVEAVSLLSHRNTHLVVVGDGEPSERALADDAAQRFGVAERMHVTGWLEGTDRVEAFTAGDVFALLSDFENFGLSVVEAMSVGCPVVISDQVFLADDLAQAGAVVCVDRDAALAAAAVDRLLDDPVEAAAMGERARELVSREFSPTAVAGRLREVSQRWAGPH